MSSSAVLLEDDAEARQRLLDSSGLESSIFEGSVSAQRGPTLSGTGTEASCFQTTLDARYQEGAGLTPLKKTFNTPFSTLGLAFRSMILPSLRAFQ